ncbi:hypothetical protein ES332_A11G007400v1 [Gossypium tomentosum]|uniref:Uncharacterized protein n=1 Tax=Gossypium tomentosum TaxID=34277 RepID=A0A5D2N5K1_GOSTO|nr:hypothetical protein ES332_A11G007400v1 [Gossypium tomentosum]
MAWEHQLLPHTLPAHWTEGSSCFHHIYLSFFSSCTHTYIYLYNLHFLGTNFLTFFFFECRCMERCIQIRFIWESSRVKLQTKREFFFMRRKLEILIFMKLHSNYIRFIWESSRVKL